MDRIEKKYGWFAHNLREMRAAEDRLSQSRMAHHLGISMSAIQHIEDRSSKNPGVYHVCAMADYFGVPIQDFLQKDVSVRSQLEQTIAFIQDEMDESELRPIYGAVKEVRAAKRESGFYRRRK